MTIEEQIKKTYESNGFVVLEVKLLPDGSYDVEFLTSNGMAIRNVVCAFIVRHEYSKRQQQNPVPNN